MNFLVAKIESAVPIFIGDTTKFKLQKYTFRKYYYLRDDPDLTSLYKHNVNEMIEL